LKGKLDVEGLEEALKEIVRRHETLRTVFSSVEGRPVQVIKEEGDVRLEVEELIGEGEEKEEEARRITREEARKGFDLEKGPLVRVKLLRLGEEEHVLVVVMHHIVSDAWSMGVLVREVAALYGRKKEGKESGLKEPRIQYADYAAWQRGWLKGGELERQLSYWKTKLAGAPSVLNLPTDRPRPSILDSQGDAEPFRLSEDLTRSLESLSREEGATLFMTLLAAFKTLLSRYCKQEDIVVGVDIANRNRSRVENLIGYFVNM